MNIYYYNQNMSDKQTFICEFCQKVYKRKSYYEKHLANCEENEIEEFNYEGLIEHWKDIDPQIASCFENELEKLLKES